MGKEALWLIGEDLAAVEQAADVCERRIMAEEKVPVAKLFVGLSDSDTYFYR